MALPAHHGKHGTCNAEIVHYKREVLGQKAAAATTTGGNDSGDTEGSTGGNTGGSDSGKAPDPAL